MPRRGHRDCPSSPHVHCDVCDAVIKCEHTERGFVAVVPAINVIGYYWKEIANVEPSQVILCAEHGLPIMEHLAHVLPMPPPHAHTLN